MNRRTMSTVATTPTQQGRPISRRNSATLSSIQQFVGSQNRDKKIRQPLIMQAGSEIPLPSTEGSTRGTAGDMSEINGPSTIALPDGPTIESLSIVVQSPTHKDHGSDISHSAPSAVPGVIGLQNIGNTCFMNSVLQCLLHCRPLCEYFLSGQYKEEINESNALGSGGKLVTEFAKLVEQVWVHPTDSSVTPRDLKWVIGQHAPMFVGYHQHDSQELVTFLLDGLHEDLNLVKSKPYTEAIEANDRPDSVVAKLCWEQHLLRNRSKIVDLFQGQFKSRLSCPHCNKSSVTFDPFMYLSLPIPNHPDLPLLVTFTFAQADQTTLPPVRLAINVFRDATDLPRAIAAAVAAELPSEYSDTIIADEILVYSQSTTYNAFQLMDGTNIYATSSLAAKKRVFCTYAPRLLSSPTPLSPVAQDGPLDHRSSDAEPFAKRQKNNTIVISIQTRICPSSRWVTPSGSITPSLHYVPIGPPTAVVVATTTTGAELMALIKRTVLYSLGSRSKELLEGMKKGAVIRVVEHGATVATIVMGADLPDDFLSQKPTGAVASDATHTPVTLYVDIPINDDNSSSDGEDAVAWDDIVSSIQTKASDYYRTEKSWRLTSVMANSPVSASQKVSIDDCFRLFSSEEVLGESDQWYCSHCKEHVRASKKLDLWTMPEVLIVHFKRFQYNRGFRNKIETVINFPSGEDLLDVEQFLPPAATQQALKYKLFGVSNHMGSLYSGHYTAFAKMWPDAASPTHRRTNVC